MNILLTIWLLPTLIAAIILLALSINGKLWAHHKLLGNIAVGVNLAGIPLIFASNSFITGLFLALNQLLFLFLGARLSFGRLPEDFLRNSTRLNAAVATIILSIILIYSRFGINFDPSWLLLGLSFLVALAFLAQVIWTLEHYKLRRINPNLRLRDLPTVTLAIPARNETHALTDCLQAAVASDYPKLEIIAVDDCSQDRTPEMVKSFAHDGVRFIQGEVPAEGWLGKNQAFQLLADNALGDYVIFAGVDTHLAPQSISKMVAYAISNKIEMLSILPNHREGLHLSTLLPQMRYYWQIVFPITKHRVPVASPCWLIKKEILKQLGGFEAVRHKIMPEGSFARRLANTDLYRFIISDEDLGVTTGKKWSSQNESALRLLYPTFKRQPIFALAGIALLVCLLIFPFAVLITKFLNHQQGLQFWAATLDCLLLIIGYLLVVVRTHTETWIVTFLTYPLVLIQEVILIIVSMLQYEFGDVNWKGRNVCYPVITQYGHLPRFENRKPHFKPQ